LLAAEPTELQGDLFAARSPRARVAICAPPPTRDLIAALLTRKGYAVFAVADPADLRRLLASGSSEVDVFLAGGPAAADGAALVEVLGEMPARPPAVVFFAEPATTSSPWTAYPACRFLWGPVVPELLVEEIERALGSAHESREQTQIH
jgi:DNA-binding NtrC family response regulator